VTFTKRFIRRASATLATALLASSIITPPASAGTISTSVTARGWTLQTTVTASTVTKSHRIESTFKSPVNAAGRYIVRVTVRDLSDRVVQRWTDTVALSNGQGYEFLRQMNTSALSGKYIVEQGVWTDDWKVRVGWNAQAATFTIAPVKVTTPPSTTPVTLPVETTTTTAPAPTTTTTAAPSVTVPTGDINGWKLKFSDDFNVDAAEGSFLSTYRNWDAYATGWPDTSRRGMYDTNILSVDNGTMNMRLHTGADGKPRAAVPFPLINGRDSNDATNQLYGRYEVRFRADPVQGYKTAFLLWPKSEVWPRDGEIDFPEGELTDKIYGFMHRQGATSGGDQDWFSTGVGYNDWHTAVTEWTPNSVKFILDGRVIGTSTSRIPNTPMHWVLQTETTLGGGEIPASASGNVQFDHVKVWSYSPSTFAG
jgi:hypothetical protein